MKHDAKHKVKEIGYTAIAEVSLYLLLYYVQYLLDVPVKYWLSSFILLALLNLTIGFCPFVRKCYRTPF